LDFGLLQEKLQLFAYPIIEHQLSTWERLKFCFQLHYPYRFASSLGARYSDIFPCWATNGFLWMPKILEQWPTFGLAKVGRLGVAYLSAALLWFLFF
jgi:hypothetical protein